MTIEDPGGPRTPAPDKPAILSAHFAINDAPPLDGADALPVVFSVELDAATVVPEYFFIGREDGRRARPDMAILAPANEADENRTVLLIGDFGAPDETPATTVAVSGPVYSEAGGSLRGLASPVLAFDTPPTVVFAERLAPQQGRCAGAGSVVRTYWTEGLRALDPDSTSKVTIELDDGSSRPAVAFDDQGAPGLDGGDDNVLDICLGDKARPVRLQIAAAILTDPAGHTNIAIDVDIAGG